MKFLCDVHISYKVQKFLSDQGHAAFHVNELPRKWDTKDKEICLFTDAEDCIVITKDADFVDFYYIRQSPKKLIKINLGNIATSELIRLLSEVLPLLQKLLSRKRFLVEVDKDGTYTIDQTT
jgi:predicted nuclease of predicted toxin-antitoxin system